MDLQGIVQNKQTSGTMLSRGKSNKPNIIEHLHKTVHIF